MCYAKKLKTNPRRNTNRGLYSVIIGYDHSQRLRTAEGELEKPERKMLCTPTAKFSSP